MFNTPISCPSALNYDCIKLTPTGSLTFIPAQACNLGIDYGTIANKVKGDLKIGAYSYCAMQGFAESLQQE